MEITDEAFVLAARAHGDTGAVVDLLTQKHGRRAAYVAGGASRRVKPFLQPGARVEVELRSRTAEQLGSARLEPVGEGPSALFDDPVALAGLASAAAVAQAALPEREAHPGAFFALEALTGVLILPEVWPAVYVRYELGLLEELGFGLDLSVCAVSGSRDDLAFVSPRTGRAVSMTAAAPYADRLLRLPPFLLGAQAGLGPGDVRAGLDLAAHFLARCVFDPLNRPLPEARDRMVARLAAAGLA
jgi:DNA repair protein RecO (recombination protein O)